MKGKKIAHMAYKAAKPIAKRQAKRFMDSRGEQMKTKAKGYLGKKTDRLVDRGADRLGVKNQELRGSAKKLARKGVNKGIDVGAAYINKKLSS